MTNGNNRSAAGSPTSRPVNFSEPQIMLLCAIVQRLSSTLPLMRLSKHKERTSILIARRPFHELGEPLIL